VTWGIVDETAPLREVLVGPPGNFRWLPTSAISKAALASGRELTPLDVASAHAELVSALEGSGAKVHTLPADPVLPYQVFARDSSIWCDAGPIVTQMHQWWRRGEYAPVLEFYADAGIPVHRMVTAAALEGGDLVVIAPKVALLGFCEERTQKPAAEQVAGWLEDLGWEVRLQPFDPHFVHIDVLVCMAAAGLAVVCAEAAPPGLLDWLHAHRIETLGVLYADAFALRANVLALGNDRVVSAAGSPANAALAAEGLEVLTPDLWPFTMGGGGPHCLSQPLKRGD
jgi:N-dimethylarginine dimethylaminohydrolase